MSETPRDVFEDLLSFFLDERMRDDQPTRAQWLMRFDAAARIGSGQAEAARCPLRGNECSRDEVDVGVGIVAGPYGCSCGWSEWPEYDRRNNRAVGLDSCGGLTPVARRHSLEEIRDVWLNNRNADGSDWEQALGAVYDLGAGV